MAQTWRTCRFCGGTADHGRMVHYSVRHYGHFHCYLDAGKTLAELHDWQLRCFPFFLLNDRGLLAEVERRLSKATA